MHLNAPPCAYIFKQGKAITKGSVSLVLHGGNTVFGRGRFSVYIYPLSEDAKLLLREVKHN